MPYIPLWHLESRQLPLVYEFDSKLRNSGRSLPMRRKVLTNLKTMPTFAQGRGLVAQNVARGAVSTCFGTRPRAYSSNTSAGHRSACVMGRASINMTFDRYGHLFESVEADREAIAKIEAAVRTA